MIQRLMLAGALALLISLPGLAQAQRLVGTVTKLDGTTVTVKAADGQEASFKLADATMITSDEPATLADMKKGEFIACTAAKVDGGAKLKAVDIHILPEAMKGVGEGHSTMGQINNTMTNGFIEQFDAKTDGKVLKVTYKGGEVDVEVGPDATIRRLAVRDKSAVKVGASLNVIARKEADGSAVANFISVLPAKS
jgi:hypothetical protein